MALSEMDGIKRKLAELDMKVNVVSHLLFSYIQAMLALLNDKELTNPEEFRAYLEKCKQELSRMSGDAQFRSMMKDILPDEKGGAGK